MFDQVTSKLLIMLSVENNNLAADLYKEMNERPTGTIKPGIHAYQDTGPNQDQVKWVSDRIGKRVKMRTCGRVGTIVSVLMADRGLYPGGRYPCEVKLDGGNTYEYPISYVCPEVISFEEALGNAELILDFSLFSQNDEKYEYVRFCKYSKTYDVNVDPKELEIIALDTDNEDILDFSMMLNKLHNAVGLKY